MKHVRDRWEAIHYYLFFLPEKPNHDIFAFPAVLTNTTIHPKFLKPSDCLDWDGAGEQGPDVSY